MRGDYTRAELVGGETIALVWSERYPGQLWVIVRMHKHHRCVILDDSIAVGEQAFRPVTNGYNRMDRISIRGMDVLLRRTQRSETAKPRTD